MAIIYDGFYSFSLSDKFFNLEDTLYILLHQSFYNKSSFRDLAKYQYSRNLGIKSVYIDSGTCNRSDFKSLAKKRHLCSF